MEEFRLYSRFQPTSRRRQRLEKRSDFGAAEPLEPDWRILEALPKIRALPRGVLA
jgi:hypothetical protein